MHGGRNVEQERFPIGRGDQDRSLCQELLDLVKRLLGLGHLFKMVSLLQKPIEGETVTPRVFKILKSDMSSYALQSIWHLVKTL